MNALEVLRDAGLSLRADGNVLKVKPSTKITPELRQLIRLNRDALLERVRHASNGAGIAARAHAGRKVASVSGNPLVTLEQGNACHTPSWSDEETVAFLARRGRLMAWGRPEQDAEDLAERLTLAAREQDDRVLCATCQHGEKLRCPDGQPMPPGVLHRCFSYSDASL